MPKWLGKLKAIIGWAEVIAPIAPIPDKTKRAVAKVGGVERSVEDLVKEIKAKRVEDAPKPE